MGKGGPIGTVTNAVSSVANTVGGAVSNIPVIGHIGDAAVKGVGQAVDASINGIVAVPKGVIAIAEGQNVLSATGEAFTGTVAGAVGAVSAPTVAVFNSVTPSGVQELPLVSNVEAFNASSLDIANNQNYSSGALENFYRNGAEIGAVAATAGIAGGGVGGADAGGEAVGTDVTASAGSDVATASAEDTLTVSTADAGSVADVTVTDISADIPAAGIGDGVSAGAVTATDIAPAAGGSGILGTAETVGEVALGTGVAQKFLGSKLPSFADQLLGLPDPSQAGGTKTIIKPGANASGGGGGGGGGGLGMTPAQASLIVAAGIAAVIIWKAKG